jgi:BMFP domain-containing protein YqiC
MNGEIIESFQGQQIHIRQPDGYWNATQMCQKYGKLFADFYRLKTTKDYLAALSENMGIPIFSLVESQKGRGSQTWVHSRIALKLAAWLSPRFEVWVYSVIEKLLTQGYVSLREEFDVLAQIFEISETQNRELLDQVAALERDLWELEGAYRTEDQIRNERDYFERLLRENGIDPWGVRDNHNDPDAR